MATTAQKAQQQKAAEGAPRGRHGAALAEVALAADLERCAACIAGARVGTPIAAVPAAGTAIATSTTGAAAG